MHDDTYKNTEKKIKKELLIYTAFCLNIVDMINPANKRDLVNTLQKEAFNVSRKIIKY